MYIYVLFKIVGINNYMGKINQNSKKIFTIKTEM